MLCECGCFDQCCGTCVHAAAAGTDRLDRDNAGDWQPPSLNLYCSADARNAAGIPAKSGSEKSTRTRAQQQRDRRARQRIEAAAAGERATFAEKELCRKKRQREEERRALGRPWRAEGQTFTLPPQLSDSMRAACKQNYEYEHGIRNSAPYLPDDIVTWLGRHSIDAIDKHGNTLLQLATHWDSGPRIISELLRRGASVQGNPELPSPLFNALAGRWAPWGCEYEADSDAGEWQVVS